jgi:hypothetical protein
LLRPVYAFSANMYCSCPNIPLQNIPRKKSNLDHLLHVRLSSSHDTTHPLLSLQSHATRRPPAGYRRPPISAISMVERPPPTNGSQQPSFLRLSKFLRFSPRTNAVRPGRKDQSRDPLDVCLFLLFLSQFAQHSCCSSLLHHPYPPIAFTEKTLHRLPYPVVAPFSIPLGPRQVRGSESRVNRNDNPSKLSMFLSDKPHMCVICNSHWAREL